MSHEHDITVCTGSWDRIRLTESTGQEEYKAQLRKLNDKQILGAFRWTARILDEIAYDIIGGGDRSYDPKKTEYYRGLVELKRIADERELVITGDKPYEDMTGVHQAVTSFFDPMKTPFVIDLLTSNSSE